MLIAAELYLDGGTIIANKDVLGKIKAYVKLGLHLTDLDYTINDHYGADFEKMQMEVMEMEWKRN